MSIRIVVDSIASPLFYIQALTVEAVGAPVHIFFTPGNEAIQSQPLPTVLWHGECFQSDVLTHFPFELYNFLFPLMEMFWYLQQLLQIVSNIAEGTLFSGLYCSIHRDSY